MIVHANQATACILLMLSKRDLRHFQRQKIKIKKKIKKKLKIQRLDHYYAYSASAWQNVKRNDVL